MLRRPSRSDLAAFRAIPWPPAHRANTTLAVVATDAALDKAECTRVAGAAHDGMARAISPIHTYTDGDVAFVLATGALPVPEAPTDGFIRPAARASPSSLRSSPPPPTSSPGRSSTPC